MRIAAPNRVPSGDWNELDGDQNRQQTDGGPSKNFSDW
jgi:hypothetical protein